MNSMFLSLFNLKLLDDSRYSVISTQGPFEVRLYQRMLCAKITLSGKYEEAVANGIKHLSDYIEGSNFKVDKIEHYGPYFHVHKNSSWDIGLILPSYFSLSSAPRPISRMIKLEEIAPGKVGVLRYKGNIAHETVQRRAEELKRWLNFKGLNPVGPLRVSTIDLLVPVPFFRNNEVHFDVM